MIKISPSILASDFANLETEIRRIETADYVHVDVMDGLFVPNITIGIPVVAAIRKKTDMLLDVHLMIDRPVRYVEEFCKAGADIVTIHVEADTEENTMKAIDLIHGCGKKAGVVVKPKTSAEAVLPFLDKCDIVLVMTVEPGFGGQSFMADMMPKVTALRQEIDRRGLSVSIQVDGGIGAATAPVAAAAGADVAVMGSAVFNDPDPRALVAQVQAL